MAIDYFTKGSTKEVSKGFKACEFDCPCTNCAVTLVDSELVSMLSALREKVGKPIAITSGYRCTKHQQELKNSGYETAQGVSQHSLGKAADIVVSGMDISGLIADAIEVGFKSIGAGKTFLHLDTRGIEDGKTRYWTYLKR